MLERERLSIFRISMPGRLSISKKELLAKNLVDIYKTLSSYDLLSENIETYYQTQ